MRLGWYILLVRQGFEQLVREQLLLNKDLLDFKDVVIQSDLSCYVFIRTTEIKNQANYLVDGTLKFLGSKKEGPKKFTTEQIRKLDISGVVLKKERPNFKKGDHVIIKKGDLSDIDGVVIEVGKRILKIKPTYLQKIIKIKIQDVDYI